MPASPRLFSGNQFRSSPAAMLSSKSSSTVAVVDTGEHLFKVVGYSKVQGNGALMSETFRVGSLDWAIHYYPNGAPWVADQHFTSAYLQLVSTIESDVTASFCLSLLQDPTSPATGGEKHKKSCTRKFLPSMTDEDGKTWGHMKFMSKDDLAASGCLHDDCLVIKCTLEITKLIEEDPKDDERNMSTIIVPPAANLSTDFGNLLETGHKADLTVDIGKEPSSKSFNLHTSVVGARSPALLAQLSSGSSMEAMDAKVFEVLLHYIYKDCLPGFMEEDTEEAASMARALLAPAHGCGIGRLRVMCESRLSRSLDVNNVSSTLDLAEQYACDELKECCLKYMAADGERLRTITGTKGFEQLVKNRPHVVRHILDKLIIIDKPKSQAVTTTPPAQ